MAFSSSIAVRELPLFPLPEVVLFPGRPLPLHIFEFRYRIMMNTILELCLGQQRFRVLDYTREKPYRVGLVEWIEDQPQEKNLAMLSTEVQILLKDVVNLSAKLTEQEITLPEDLPDLPTELSYWVASNFYGVAAEQQALLEMQNTAARLEREVEILTSTRNHLAARTVLKDTFNDDDSQN
jgi:ATP-dependent Lon protease